MHPHPDIPPTSAPWSRLPTAPPAPGGHPLPYPVNGYPPLGTTEWPPYGDAPYGQAPPHPSGWDAPAWAPTTGTFDAPAHQQSVQPLPQTARSTRTSRVMAHASGPVLVLLGAGLIAPLGPLAVYLTSARDAPARRDAARSFDFHVTIMLASAVLLVPFVLVVLTGALADPSYAPRVLPLLIGCGTGYLGLAGLYLFGVVRALVDSMKGREASYPFTLPLLGR